MILTPLWILVRFCRRRLFTPSFVCLFVCLSQLALREVSVMLYNIARQVLITSKNEDNFKNEDNLKTEDSLKMKKTSKLRRPQTLRLSIILKRPKKWWQPKNENDLKKEDNLKNQDEDSKEGCTYWAYTTTFVVLVSRVLQISICTLTFNLPFHHRTVMWYFGWNEGLCDIFTVFLSKPNPNSNSMQLGLRLDTKLSANPPHLTTTTTNF